MTWWLSNCIGNSGPTCLIIPLRLRRHWEARAHQWKNSRNGGHILLPKCIAAIRQQQWQFDKCPFRKDATYISTVQKVFSNLHKTHKFLVWMYRELCSSHCRFVCPTVVPHFREKLLRLIESIRLVCRGKWSTVFVMLYSLFAEKLLCD